MPQSLKCRIKKLCFKKQITEEERDSLLAKLDNHDKELIIKFAEKLGYYMYDLPNNTQMKGIEANAIHDLLKEYGVN